MSNTSNKTASKPAKASDGDSTEDGGHESPASSSDGKVHDKLEELELEASLRSQTRTMRTGPGRKKKNKGGDAAAASKPKKAGKQMTKWEDSKLSKKEISALNRASEVRLVLARSNGWTHPLACVGSHCLLLCR